MVLKYFSHADEMVVCSLKHPVLSPLNSFALDIAQSNLHTRLVNAYSLSSFNIQDKPIIIWMSANIL